jgi:uncharacterized RDD family membrane protein YckC
MPQSVIPRGVAYLIDTAVVAVLTAVLMAAGVIQGGDLKTFDPDAVREMLRSNSGLEVYLILFAYFLICEGLTGRTVGKVALGLRVVRLTDGGSCGWSRSLVRNLVRPFDLLFVGLPGALVVMFTPARQRLGDLLGGTLVVRRITVPAAMVPVMPGLLRVCGNCGRLAPAAGPCPGCSAPAPAPLTAAGQPFGLAVPQPLAGMMAAGEAAAALRAAAQEVLAAESAYGAASAAESARIGRAGADQAAESEGESSAGATDDAAPGETAPEETTPADVPPVETAPDAFVHTEDAPDMSGEYIAAWRGLMAAVEALRARRLDLDAALATARVTLEQVTTADTVLRGLLDEVAPYLDADDDEAVLAAFMARASAGGDAGAGTPS